MKIKRTRTLTPERLAVIETFAQRGPLRGDLVAAAEHHQECRKLIAELAAALRREWTKAERQKRQHER